MVRFDWLFDAAIIRHVIRMWLMFGCLSYFVRSAKAVVEVWQSTASFSHNIRWLRYGVIYDG